MGGLSGAAWSGAEWAGAPTFGVRGLEDVGERLAAVTTTQALCCVITARRRRARLRGWRRAPVLGAESEPVDATRNHPVIVGPQ